MVGFTRPKRSDHASPVPPAPHSTVRCRRQRHATGITTAAHRGGFRMLITILIILAIIALILFIVGRA